jgi:uncharacterized spore protein YtfJ
VTVLDYGDPVVVGDRTVIPIAQVRYGFGGGGGQPKVRKPQVAVAAAFRLGQQEPWK